MGKAWETWPNIIDKLGPKRAYGRRKGIDRIGRDRQKERGVDNLKVLGLDVDWIAGRMPAGNPLSPFIGRYNGWTRRLGPGTGENGGRNGGGGGGFGEEQRRSNEYR